MTTELKNICDPNLTRDGKQFESLEKRHLSKSIQMENRVYYIRLRCFLNNKKIIIKFFIKNES